MPDPSTTTVTTTLNSVPPPGDIVKTAKHTVTTVVSTVTTATGLTKTPTSSPDREPASHPALRLPSRPADQARLAAHPAAASWSLPSGAQLSDLMPSMPSESAEPAALTPVLAAAAGVAPASQRQPAAIAAEIADRGNGTMRGVLIALAAASAATLAYAHVSTARGSRRI